MIVEHYTGSERKAVFTQIQVFLVVFANKHVFTILPNGTISKICGFAHDFDSLALTFDEILDKRQWLVCEHKFRVYFQMNVGAKEKRENSLNGNAQTRFRPTPTMESDAIP